MVPSRILLPLLPCLWLLPVPGRGDAPVVLETPELQISAGAVDPQNFHLTAWRGGNVPPPASPFVVQTTPAPGATARKEAAGDLQVRTAGGEVTVAPGGHFRLQGPGGRALVSEGTFTDTNGKIVLTLAHDPQERFYGAGNEGRNRSGDLTHPSGTQTVDNGVTRVPFLWSTGGWSVLIANNQNGTGWHDDHGVLTVTVHGPFADVYLGVGANGYELLDDYSRLTGRAPIPPRWTFGFMQSRWGYNGVGDVQDKWHQFRDRKSRSMRSSTITTGFKATGTSTPTTSPGAAWRR